MLVEADGRNIFEERVIKDERRAVLRRLLPSTEHKVSVTAVFTDEIRTLNSVDIFHKGE